MYQKALPVFRQSYHLNRTHLCRGEDEWKKLVTGLKEALATLP